MQDFIGAISAHIRTIATAEQPAFPQTPFLILQVPEKHLAFHLVDLETWLPLSAKVNANFFGEMSAQFAQQEVQLVHVWEDVWRSQPSLVEARIATLLGRFTRYHARQTTVEKITNPTLRAFLAQHHLQIPIDGRYKYGLYAQGELLAVASFSARRPMNRGGTTCNSYELLRFASQSSCVVAGGLGKLLAHFEREQHPDDIMTYVDLDWGTGKGYRQLGFEPVGELPPRHFLLNTSTCERHYPHRLTTQDAASMVTVFNAGSRKFLKVRSEENY